MSVLTNAELVDMLELGGEPARAARELERAGWWHRMRVPVTKRRLELVVNEWGFGRRADDTDIERRLADELSTMEFHRTAATKELTKWGILEMSPDEAYAWWRACLLVSTDPSLVLRQRGQMKTAAERVWRQISAAQRHPCYRNVAVMGSKANEVMQGWRTEAGSIHLLERDALDADEGDVTFGLFTPHHPLIRRRRVTVWVFTATSGPAFPEGRQPLAART